MEKNVQPAQVRAWIKAAGVMLVIVATSCAALVGITAVVLWVDDEVREHGRADATPARGLRSVSGLGPPTPETRSARRLTLGVGWTPYQSDVSDECLDGGDSVYCKASVCRYGWAVKLKGSCCFACGDADDGPAYCYAGGNVPIACAHGYLTDFAGQRTLRRYCREVPNTAAACSDYRKPSTVHWSSTYYAFDVGHPIIKYDDGVCVHALTRAVVRCP